FVLVRLTEDGREEGLVLLDPSEYLHSTPSLGGKPPSARQVDKVEGITLESYVNDGKLRSALTAWSAAKVSGKAAGWWNRRRKEMTQQIDPTTQKRVFNEIQGIIRKYHRGASSVPDFLKKIRGNGEGVLAQNKKKGGHLFDELKKYYGELVQGGVSANTPEMIGLQSDIRLLQFFNWDPDTFQFRHLVQRFLEAERSGNVSESLAVEVRDADRLHGNLGAKGTLRLGFSEGEEVILSGLGDSGDAFELELSIGQEGLQAFVRVKSGATVFQYQIQSKPCRDGFKINFVKINGGQRSARHLQWSDTSETPLAEDDSSSGSHQKRMGVPNLTQEEVNRVFTRIDGGQIVTRGVREEEREQAKKMLEMVNRYAPEFLEGEFGKLGLKVEDIRLDLFKKVLGALATPPEGGQSEKGSFITFSEVRQNYTVQIYLAKDLGVLEPAVTQVKDHTIRIAMTEGFFKDAIPHEFIEGWRRLQLPVRMEALGVSATPEKIDLFNRALHTEMVLMEPLFDLDLPESERVIDGTVKGRVARELIRRRAQDPKSLESLSQGEEAALRDIQEKVSGEALSKNGGELAQTFAKNVSLEAKFNLIQNIQDKAPHFLQSLEREDYLSLLRQHLSADPEDQDLTQAIDNTLKFLATDQPSFGDLMRHIEGVVNLRMAQETSAQRTINDDARLPMVQDVAVLFLLIANHLRSGRTYAGGLSLLIENYVAGNEYYGISHEILSHQSLDVVLRYGQKELRHQVEPIQSYNPLSQVFLSGLTPVFGFFAALERLRDQKAINALADLGQQTHMSDELKVLIQKSQSKILRFSTTGNLEVLNEGQWLSVDLSPATRFAVRDFCVRRALFNNGYLYLDLASLGAIHPDRFQKLLLTLLRDPQSLKKGWVVKYHDENDTKKDSDLEGDKVGILKNGWLLQARVKTVGEQYQDRLANYREPIKGKKRDETPLKVLVMTQKTFGIELAQKGSGEWEVKASRDNFELFYNYSIQLLQKNKFKIVISIVLPEGVSKGDLPSDLTEKIFKSVCGDRCDQLKDNMTVCYYEAHDEAVRSHALGAKVKGDVIHEFFAGAQRSGNREERVRFVIAEGDQDRYADLLKTDPLSGENLVYLVVRGALDDQQMDWILEKLVSGNSVKDQDLLNAFKKVDRNELKKPMKAPRTPLERLQWLRQEEEATQGSM
ncbi:MAG: hypothetical protein HYS07_02865, partial [Chlamydiae bacterium]|nr:hypothetical protein [Chlamydiota bacterium]MBI3277648.1 hypothetical protein [Chlamydiota bacterium]